MNAAANQLSTLGNIKGGVMQETNDTTGEIAPDLLEAAFDLYKQTHSPVKRELVKKLAAALPGRGDKAYGAAFGCVHHLFDNACQMAFRWANENPPGAEIDDVAINQVFLGELSMKVPGFSPNQYAEALGYAFENSIF
jgi:hypothetical protein